MSVVLAAAFPDFGLLISDSRITINGTIKRDELQKIYQLGKHLAVGFTSDDVGTSYRIIYEMTRYSQKLSRSQHSLYLLDKLPKVANYHYEKLTKGRNPLPRMDFSYVGIINDRITQLDSKFVFDLIKRFKNSFTLSPEMQRSLFSAKNGIMKFPPPIPSVLVQEFPSNRRVNFHTLGVSLRGSGAVAFSELEKEIEKVLLCPDKNMRIVMFQLSLNNYCKKNNITSVGGLNQIIIIDRDGIKPQSYSHSSVLKDGKFIGGKKMEFKPGGWVQIDLDTGKEVKVKHYNPLILEKDDNEFASFQGMSC